MSTEAILRRFRSFTLCVRVLEAHRHRLLSATDGSRHAVQGPGDQAASLGSAVCEHTTGQATLTDGRVSWPFQVALQSGHEQQMDAVLGWEKHVL
jgi:hypothetical protein